VHDCDSCALRIYAALRAQGYSLLLDTGATRTLITLGSQEGYFPLIRLAFLAVGAAAVEDLQVRVLTALPSAPFIDGLLGEDFLNRMLGRETTRDSGSSLPLLHKIGQALSGPCPGAPCSASASARIWP